MKYKIKEDESKTDFVARIINGSDKVMTASDVDKAIDKKAKATRGTKKEQWQAFLGAAVRKGLIAKTRAVKNHETGGTHVVYHPLHHHPIGDEIPQPLFTRTNGDFNKTTDDNGYVSMAKRVGFHTTFDEDDSSKNLIKHHRNLMEEFHPLKFAESLTESRDAIVSTVKHEFTAEQLLESLEVLNQDLHDNVIVAIFTALGKNNYSPINYGAMDFTKPQPRKTALMEWTFTDDGNLVVKE